MNIGRNEQKIMSDKIESKSLEMKEVLNYNW